MNKITNQGKRPLIALISNQYIDFHKDIATKLNRVLKDAGYGLICVSGGALEPAPDTNTANLAARNEFYKITQNYDVAGYVILTATIGNHAKANQLIKFVKQYTHKPVVSFGVDLPGIASVSIDNRQSMSIMMEHMTQDPERKRFVFIRGYRNIPDSTQRENAFRETLTKKGIPVVESLIVDGNFNTADSYFAMDKLLQTTHDIDVIVAASDRMALSAVHALNKHGLRVPQDVIVSGFDNTTSSNGSLPPLTTIAYSMTERVEITVDSLLAQIDSGVFEDHNRGPLYCTTTLIVRESTDTVFESSVSETHDSNNSFNAKHFQDEILEGLSTLKTPDEVNVSDVVEDIVSILVNGAAESGAKLETTLRGLHNSPDDIYWWRHLHYQIGSKLQRYGTEGQSPQALSLISKMLSQIHETLWSVEATLQFEESRYQEIQFRLRLNLNASTSTEQLKNTLSNLANQYPGLIAFLCLYDNPGIEVGSSATLAFQHPVAVLEIPANQSFPTQDILPLGFLNTELDGPFIIEPLCIGFTQLGYIVFEISNPDYRDKVNSTALADNISSALWRIAVEEKSQIE